MKGFKGKLMLVVVLIVMVFPACNVVQQPKSEIKIEKLEPMRMVAVSGVGEGSELGLMKEIAAFAEERNLKLDLKTHRIFGHDTKEGYRMMLTVGQDIEAEGNMEIVEHPGGTFATATCKGIKNTLATWESLVQWQKNSAFGPIKASCFEEVLTPPGTPESEIVLKLYLPIR